MLSTIFSPIGASYSPSSYSFIIISNTETTKTLCSEKPFNSKTYTTTKPGLSFSSGYG